MPERWTAQPRRRPHDDDRRHQRTRRAAGRDPRPPALLFAEQPLPEPCRAVLAAHPSCASAVPGCSPVPQASPARLHWQCMIEGLKLGCNTSSVCSCGPTRGNWVGCLLGFLVQNLSPAAFCAGSEGLCASNVSPWHNSSSAPSLLMLCTSARII